MIKEKENKEIDELFEAGAHIAYSKTRRHPTQQKYIFGSKNGTEIFDLEKTSLMLKKAEEAAKAIGKSRGQLLVVGTKFEVRSAVRAAADSIGQPYVTERWLGGTLTNFGEIRKRVGRLEDLTMKKEKGLLGMYTKKERLLLDREIAKLMRFFSGIINMKALPMAMFIVDPREEFTAVAEAKQCKIPTIALAGSDCDISDVTYPIPANDASRTSVSLIVDKIIRAYKEGLAEAPEQVTNPVVSHVEPTLAGTTILGTAE